MDDIQAKLDALKKNLEVVYREVGEMQHMISHFRDHIVDLEENIHDIFSRLDALEY